MWGKTMITCVKVAWGSKWRRAGAYFEGPTDAGSSPSSSLVEIYDSHWTWSSQTSSSPHSVLWPPPFTSLQSVTTTVLTERGNWVWVSIGLFNIKRRTFTVFTLESEEAEWLITYLSLTQLSHRMHMPLPFSLSSSTSSDSLWSLFLCFALSHSCISVFHILITSPYNSLSFSFAFSISKHSIFFDLPVPLTTNWKQETYFYVDRSPTM